VKFLPKLLLSVAAVAALILAATFILHSSLETQNLVSKWTKYFGGISTTFLTIYALRKKSTEPTEGSTLHHRLTSHGKIYAAGLGFSAVLTFVSSVWGDYTDAALRKLAEKRGNEHFRQELERNTYEIIKNYRQQQATSRSEELLQRQARLGRETLLDLRRSAGALNDRVETLIPIKGLNFRLALTKWPMPPRSDEPDAVEGVEVEGSTVLVEETKSPAPPDSASSDEEHKSDKADEGESTTEPITLSDKFYAAIPIRGVTSLFYAKPEVSGTAPGGQTAVGSLSELICDQTIIGSVLSARLAIALSPNAQFVTQARLNQDDPEERRCSTESNLLISQGTTIVARIKTSDLNRYAENPIRAGRVFKGQLSEDDLDLEKMKSAFGINLLGREQRATLVFQVAPGELKSSQAFLSRYLPKEIFIVEDAVGVNDQVSEARWKLIRSGTPLSSNDSVTFFFVGKSKVERLFTSATPTP
jgi:hypothetical protein